MTSRPSTAAPILAVLAIVLVTLGAYVAGYFWLGDRLDEPFIGYPPSYARMRDDPIAITRMYQYRWQAQAYGPPAVAESWLRGIEVTTYDYESLLSGF
jgi:hypothetical protein